ncbi:MAG: NfeD family protein [Candidatus Methanomethylophilus sp.]|nr:NfeD family protein [Methanomethylophilus sp.]
MEEFYVAIALVVIGLALVTVEASSPGAYLIIPGLDLLVIGIYGMIVPEMLYTWVTVAMAIVLTIPVVIGTLILYKRLGGTEPPSTTVTGSLIGRSGVVTIETNPDNLKGKVKIGSDTWSADSDEIIPVGTEVIVETSEGVHVHVRKI